MRVNHSSWLPGPTLTMFKSSLLMAGLLAAATTASAQSCPPAGARYISDNFVARVEIVSLGTAQKHPTLGCEWRRVSDGQQIWLNLGATVTPMAPAKGGAKAAGVGERPAGGAPGAQAAQAAGPLTRGVYECDGPGGVMTGPMFGLVDDRRYRDFDGGTGSWQFEADSATLVMTSGPLKGTRYKRQAATLFRPLNAQGQIGPIRCILNKGKSLTGRW